MRKHLRAIARANMERNGAKQINKRRMWRDVPISSIFSRYWKDNLKTPDDIERKAAKTRAKSEAKRIARNAART